MSSTFTPPGDGWVEGVPAGNLGPIEILTVESLTIGTVTSPGAVPAVRRYFRRLPTLPPLPTRPGYYVAERPAYGDTVVVELLGRPAGQWVDAGDRNYLDEDTVRALGPLRPLAPVEEILNEVALISISDHDPRPVWEQFREGLDAIAAQYGVHR